MNLFSIIKGLNHKKSKGFSLIELIVVIAIIALLSTIVLAALGNARQKGRDSRRVSDLRQIRNALQLYYTANKSYPTDFTNLVTAKYIASIPNDPAGNDGTSCRGTGVGTPLGYCYAVTTDGSSYHIAAQMESNVLSNDQNCDSRSPTASTCNTTMGFATAANSLPFNGNGSTYIYDLIP